MWRWIFGSFAGWLFRKQLNILFDLTGLLSSHEQPMSSVKLLPKGKSKWLPTVNPEADELKPRGRDVNR